MVGGGITVDSTRISSFKWTAGGLDSCWRAVPVAVVQNQLEWKEYDVASRSSMSDDVARNTPVQFSSSVVMPEEEGIYLFRAYASVDHAWGATDAGVCVCVCVSVCLSDWLMMIDWSIDCLIVCLFDCLFDCLIVCLFVVW